jgi:hypothetical protein
MWADLERLVHLPPCTTFQTPKPHNDRQEPHDGPILQEKILTPIDELHEKLVNFP